jgi:hypothetical protein
MAVPKYLNLDGKLYAWRALLGLRREQREQGKREQQPTLFELKGDRRPATERTARDRYFEPSLFTLLDGGR